MTIRSTLTNRNTLVLCEPCAIKLTNNDESGYPLRRPAGRWSLRTATVTYQDWDPSKPNCHGHGGLITSEKYWVAEWTDMPSDSAPTWPQTKAEHDLFRDWQYEVAAGDTLHGFRDWVNARDEQEVDDLVAASYPVDTP